MSHGSPQSIWKRKSTMFVGGGIIIALAVMIIGLDGFPPNSDESAGAIGAANRYRAEQITDGDVLLQDEEIQALLQNDDVQRLLRDETFQKAVKDQNFGGLVEQNLMRRVILDAAFMKMAAEAGMAARLERAGYASLDPDAALSVLRRNVRDAELASRGPRLSTIAEDAQFQKLFREHALIRKMMTDVKLAAQMNDVEMQSQLREMNFLSLPSDAALASFQKVAGDAELARRNPLVADLAADAEFAKLLSEHALARRLVADQKLLGQLRDVELMSRLKDVEFAKLPADVALASFQKVARDAELAGVRSPVADIAGSAEFALLFKQHELMRTLATDADFIKQRLDPDVRAAMHEVDFASLKPDVALASFQRVAADAELARRNPRLVEIAADAEFAKLFKEHGLVRRMVLDADFIKLVADAELLPRLNRIDVSDIGSDAALAGIQRVARDAALAAPVTRVSMWAGDAEFAKLWTEHGMVRKIVADQEFLKQRLDAGLVSDLRKVDFDNLPADAALAAFQRVAGDASLAGRSPRVAEIANDAQFAKLFLEQGMVRRLVLDADFIRQRLDLRMAAGMRDVEMASSMRDVEMASRMKDVEMAASAKDVEMAASAKDVEMASRMKDVEMAASAKDVEMAASAKDVEMASRMKDVEMASRMKDVEMASSMNDVSLASFRRAALDAEMLSSNTRISDLVGDQEFAKMFKANGLARAALTDAAFMGMVADQKFASLIQHKMARRIIADVNMASSMIDMEYARTRVK